MGIYYRRRRRIAPGLDLTLTSRGVGLSAGKRGARVSVNSRGRSFLSLSRLGFMFRRRLR